MKLSIAWIFDHIQGSWKDHDIPELIARLGATTAEIDHVKEIIVDLDALSLGRVVKSTSEMVTVFSAEWKKEYEVPAFKNQVYKKDQLYLIVREKKQCRLALLTDIGSDKEGLLPALSCSDPMVTGAWKKNYEQGDYIITLDNKAITHRPDLWGHRGFAREITALLGLHLRSEDLFLAVKPIKHYEKEALPLAHNPLRVKIETTTCKRFAALYMPTVEYRASSLFTAFRLARIDARPLDTLIDATNYVMYDWGQPMHAFDAAKIDDCTLIAQRARSGEKLRLLDGEVIELTSNDCIISDGHKALALAGIMGGAESAVSSETRSLIIEAANFDATEIRLTAARCKKRTEASTRFEKSLDPHQNSQALLRFLKVLDIEELPYTAADSVSSLGPLVSEKVVIVEHDFIQRKLGVAVDFDKVIAILQALGFGVQHDKKNASYTIIVPSYRGTKDVAIKEDIVEEVGRFIGYDSIPAQSPLRTMEPIDHSDLMTIRAIKQHCAFGLAMHEVYNYAFYDEEFIKKADIKPVSVEVVNPVSENWKSLVTSLVPHLIKNVQQVAVSSDELRFFEVGRIWSIENTKLDEKRALACVFYNRKKAVDFYDCKEKLQSLFELLRMQVIWRKPKSVAQWFDIHQTAELVYNDAVIGYAGKVSQSFCARVLEGDLFIAELFLDALINRDTERQLFKQLAKYQPVELDVSMLAPFTLTVDALALIITSSDARIRDVRVIDFFEKEEWHNRRSVTMRFVVVDETKTLTKEDIEIVLKTVVANLTRSGAEIR